MMIIIIIIIVISRLNPNDILRNPGWEAQSHIFLTSALEASKVVRVRLYPRGTRHCTVSIGQDSR